MPRPAPPGGRLVPRAGFRSAAPPDPAHRDIRTPPPAIPCPTNCASTPKRCQPFPLLHPGHDRPDGRPPPRAFGLVTPLGWLLFQSTPHGYRRPSVPRALRSHSASDGTFARHARPRSAIGSTARNNGGRSDSATLRLTARAAPRSCSAMWCSAKRRRTIRARLVA